MDSGTLHSHGARIALDLDVFSYLSDRILSTNTCFILGGYSHFILICIYNEQHLCSVIDITCLN